MANYSEELTLALRLEGEERVEMLTKALNDQSKSVYDRAAAARFLKSAINEEYTAAERAAGMATEAEQALNQWGNTSHDMSLRIASDNGKIKDSYFTLGQAMRQELMGLRTEHRVTGEAFAALGMSARGSLGEMVHQISALNVTAKIAAASLEQAGGIGARFGAVLGGFALPLAGIIGAFISLNEQMKELNERWEKAGDEAFQLRVKLGELDAQAQLNFVRQQIRDAQDELKKVHPEMGFFGTALALTGGTLGIGAGVSAAEREALVKYQEQLNVVNKLHVEEKGLVKELYDQHMARADALDKLNDQAAAKRTKDNNDRVRIAEQNATLEKGGLTDVLAALDAQIAITTNLRERNDLLIARNKLETDNARVLIAEGTGPGMLEDMATIRNRAALTPTLAPLPGQQTVSQIQTEGVRQINTALAEGQMKTKAMNDAWNHLTTSMSTQTANTIGKGFVDAFGIGHTLLGQFAQDFITTFTRLASMKLISGLLSLIPGVGTFLGLGSAASPSLLPSDIGDWGDAYSPVIGAASYTSSSGANGLAPVVDAIKSFNGNLKLTLGYDTLTAAVDRGNVLMRQRRS